MNLGNIHRIVLSTYQAKSCEEYKGLKEIETLPTQIVYNVFSHNSPIDRETLFNEEELKLVNETKKILNINPKITATCISVPTLHSHCISLNVEFDRHLNEHDIINNLIEFPGVIVCNNLINNKFSESINTSGKTDVYVGRIRSDIDDKSCWNFFISGDQLLKGVGYNSVQILKKLIDSNMKYNNYEDNYLDNYNYNYNDYESDNDHDNNCDY
jgi:aspartate-semialdehyde dehydrogenase